MDKFERIEQYVSRKIRDIETKNKELAKEVKVHSIGFVNLNSYQKKVREYEDNELKIDTYKNVLCEIELS